jgi:hypothetical protein
VPTAAEFDVLASDLDDEASRLAAMVLEVERRELAAPVESIFLRAQLELLVEIIVETCRLAGSRCADLAAECRRRALLCRAYTDAWAVYERRAADWADRSRAAAPGEPVGPRPVPPSRPAIWAERG